MLDRLKPRPGARHRRKRVGRGPGSGLHKTSGRGVKGQGKRSAGRETPAYSDGGQMPLVRRLPKRGFRAPARETVAVVNVGALGVFGEDARVDVEILAARGLVPPGATVLETLRENGIPHASVCGGRARCTTCRVLVTKGLDRLPQPSGAEAGALARIGATPGMRLACQIRPTADISVMPLLPADARAADGMVRGGPEGSERLITVLFVDLRGSTALGEAKLPYDLLYILNQFFGEMTKALDATGGHYAQFAGDGLLALYGLRAGDPAAGAAAALRGAREMLARVARLDSRLRGDLPQPLRIGIGIHFGEAIVGAMGPPGAQVVTAIGETVNACARLERLTRRYDCPVIVSRRAAEAAGLAVGRKRHRVRVDGGAQIIEFYALETLADLRA